MKSTGITRKLDELGRFVLPIEIRRQFNLKEKDAVEILVDDDKIVLRKFAPSRACAITGEESSDNVQVAPGVWLSPEGMQHTLEQFEKKGVKL